MNEARINTIYWVPSAMNMIANFKALDEHRLPFLKTVLFAGEAMPTKQLNYWRRHLSADTLYANLFGPTETTDIAAYYIIDRDFRDDELSHWPCMQKLRRVCSKRGRYLSRR